MARGNPLVIPFLLLFFHLPFLSATCTSFNSKNHSTCTILNNRTYLLHQPANYDSANLHALVFSFHGRDGSSAQLETLSQFSDQGVLINENGIFAAYPQGLEGEDDETAWEGAPYAATGVDDITFALAVVKEVSLFSIDPSRVYAAGKSNGGGFVNLLACTSKSAAVFAAFAPVSAALYPGTLRFSGCSPGRYIPLINSHGTADLTVPPATGPRSPTS